LRDKEPGDLEVFDYTGQTLLFATVEAPDPLPAGQISVGAKTDWLVCQSLCVPGHAQLTLSLDAGTSSASSATQVFDKYAAQVPKPPPKGVEARFSRMGKNLEITLSGVSKGDALDFYPVPRDDVVVGHVTRNGLKLSLPIESETKTLDRMEGILVVGSGENKQGYEINAATVLVNAQTPTASASL